MRILLTATLVLFGYLMTGGAIDAYAETHTRISFDDRWICGRAGTQLEINQCSSDNFQKLDAQLNSLYKTQIERVHGKSDESRLRAAQRGWLSYIKADCLYQNGPAEFSGSIWPYLQNVCMGEHYKHRISLLKEFVNCTQEGCIGK